MFWFTNLLDCVNNCLLHNKEHIIAKQLTYDENGKEKCIFKYTSFKNRKETINFLNNNLHSPLYSVNIGWPRFFYVDIDCYCAKNICYTRNKLINKLLYFHSKLNSPQTQNQFILYYNKRYIQKKKSFKISFHAHFLQQKIYNSNEGKVLCNQLSILINTKHIDFLVYKNVQLWRLPYCIKGNDKNSMLVDVFKLQQSLLFLIPQKNIYLNLKQYYLNKTIPNEIKPKFLQKLQIICCNILKCNNINGNLFVEKKNNTYFIKLKNAFCPMHNKVHSYCLKIKFFICKNIPYLKISCHGKEYNYCYICLSKQHMFIWDFYDLQNYYVTFENFNKFCLKTIDNVYICKRKNVYQNFFSHYQGKTKNTSLKYIWTGFVNDYYYRNSKNCKSRLVCKLKQKNNKDIFKYGNFTLLCICNCCQNQYKSFTFV